MDLKQFVEAKRALEHDLAALIKARLAQFEETTSHSPRDITVRMVSLNQVGMLKTRYVLDTVKVDVPLE